MNAEIEILVEGLQYPEGVFYSSRDSCIYFVEWSADRILAYQHGKIRLVLQAGPGAGPCGLSQDCLGNLWACYYSSGQLAQISQQGEQLQIYSTWRQRRFKGPNDLVHAPNGGLFFSDSGNYQEDWLNGQAVGSVYYLGPKGGLKRAATGIAYPNGIAISPDGCSLYVAEHRRNRILVFDIAKAGVLINGRVFAELDDDCLLEPGLAFQLGPDGICVDGRGWLWVAHYGGGKLVGLDQQGRTKSLIRLQDGCCPTNLSFHPGENVLYISEAERGTLLRCLLG